jgi:hypothetical protein
MIRRYTLSEWDKRGRRMEQLAARMGFIQRKPLDQQMGKSRPKRALLQRLYGPTGQA